MIILMPRQGDPHIFVYRMSNGNWRSRCGIILPKNMTMITIATDNTFPELCRTCRDNENELLQSELNYSPQTVFNDFQSCLYGLRNHLKNEEAGSRDTYFYLANKKWPKLRKIIDSIKKR